MKKYNLYTFFIFLIGVSFGCAQTLPNTSADVQKQITYYQVNTPNPLLAFVPGDAPLVIASQRAFDENSNAFENLKERLKYIDERRLYVSYINAMGYVNSNFLNYDFEYDHYFDDDDDSGDDDVLFSSVDNYQRQIAKEEQKKKDQEYKELKQNLRNKYDKWKEECSPFYDYEGHEDDENYVIDFQKAYDKASEILTDTCQDATVNSCRCRLLEFSEFEEHQYSEYVDDIFKSLNKFSQIYRSYQNFFTDKTQYGLAPAEKQDFVLYIMDSHIVLHIGVLDANKALSELDNHILNRNGDGVFPIIPELPKDFEQLFDVENTKREEKQIDGKNWIIYQSTTEKNRSRYIGLHAENNVVTMLLFMDEEFPKNVLNIQNNAFNPSKFGQLPGHALGAIHVNFMNAGKLFAPGKFADLFDNGMRKTENEMNRSLGHHHDYECDDDERCDQDDDERCAQSDDVQKSQISITEEICQQEIRDLFSDHPYIDAYIAANDNGLLSVHAHQKLSDEMTKQVKEMVPQYPLCGTPNDDIRVELGLKPMVMWKNIKKFIQDKEKQNYQCPLTRTFVRSSSYIIDKSNELIFEDIKFLPIINNFLSANIVIYNSNTIKHFSRFEFERLTEYLVKLLNKELKLNLKEGVVQDIDIYKKFVKTKILWKGNTIYAGSDIDENVSICKASEKESNLLTAGVSKRFIDSIDENPSRRHLNVNDFYKYSLQLFVKPETDGISIHLEEIE